MIEVTGDIWEYKADALCITTNMIVKRNSHLVMGGGLAKQAADRYPGLPLVLGVHYKDYMNLTPKGKAVFPPCYDVEMPDGKIIIAFPTKYDWKDDSDLGLIMHAAKDLAEMTSDNQWKTVVLPQPGCGLGNLQWSRVKEVIGPFLNDDRFHIITPG